MLTPGRSGDEQRAGTTLGLARRAQQTCRTESGGRLVGESHVRSACGSHRFWIAESCSS